jgi:hypothetical protein
VTNSRAIAGRFQALGKFPLAGFAGDQNVFGASDEASSPVSTASHTSIEN